MADPFPDDQRTLVAPADPTSTGLVSTGDDPVVIEVGYHGAPSTMAAAPPPETVTITAEHATVGDAVKVGRAQSKPIEDAAHAAHSRKTVDAASAADKSVKTAVSKQKAVAAPTKPRR